MNMFSMGMLTACLLTTSEGRKITESGIKVGDKLLKKKFGIDVREILGEDVEVEVVEDDKSV